MNASADVEPDQPDDACSIPSQLLTVEMLRRPLESTLAAPIRVVYEAASPRPIHECFAKGLEHKLAIDPLAEGIPHDPSGEEIEDHRQVQPAFQGREVRDVRDPCGIGSLDVEVSLQEVRRHRESVLGVRGGSETALPAPLEAELPHQPSYTLAGDTVTLLAEVAQNARAPVRPAARGMRRRDLDPQARVLLDARAHRTLSPGVVARSRNREAAAKQANRVEGLLRLDEAESHLLSLAKKAVLSSTRQRNTLVQFFCRTTKVQRLPGTPVQSSGNAAQIRL